MLTRKQRWRRVRGPSNKYDAFDPTLAPGSRAAQGAHPSNMMDPKRPQPINALSIGDSLLHLLGSSGSVGSAHGDRSADRAGARSKRAGIRVRFNHQVRVVLVPSRGELDGIKSNIWWGDEDYAKFRQAYIIAVKEAGFRREDLDALESRVVVGTEGVDWCDHETEDASNSADTAVVGSGSASTAANASASAASSAAQRTGLDVTSIPKPDAYAQQTNLLFDGFPLAAVPTAHCTSEEDRAAVPSPTRRAEMAIIPGRTEATNIPPSCSLAWGGHIMNPAAASDAQIGDDEVREERAGADEVDEADTPTTGNGATPLRPRLPRHPSLRPSTLAAAVAALVHVAPEAEPVTDERAVRSQSTSTASDQTDPEGFSDDSNSDSDIVGEGGGRVEEANFYCASPRNVVRTCSGTRENVV